MFQLTSATGLWQLLSQRAAPARRTNVTRGLGSVVDGTSSVDRFDVRLPARGGSRRHVECGAWQIQRSTSAPAASATTSGSPTFYPEDLKKKDDAVVLRRASCRAVELNNTFYRMPSEKCLAVLGEQVPDHVPVRGQGVAPHDLVQQAGRLRRDWSTTCSASLKPLGERGSAACSTSCRSTCAATVRRVARVPVEEQPEGVRTAFEFVHDSWHDRWSRACCTRGGATMVVGATRTTADEPEFADGRRGSTCAAPLGIR